MDFIFIFIFIFLSIMFYKYNIIIANKLDLFDNVDEERKLKKSRTPLTGGIIILFSIIYAIIFFNKDVIKILDINEHYFLIALLSIFFLGFIDDKKNVSPNIKLFFFILIIFLYLKFSDTEIKLLSFHDIDVTINIQLYSTIFLVFSLISFINAINMMDGINMIVGSYFLFITIYIISILSLNIFFIVILISLILFLFNNYKNKIYLGDSGVYVLSFLFGILFINLFLNHQIYCDQILLLMLIPGLELTRLSIERIKNRRHPFFADNRHLHHLLLKKFNENTTFAVLFSLILVPNLFALFFSQYLITIFFVILIYTLIIIRLRFAD